jgi:hypothetical protein
MSWKTTISTLGLAGVCCLVSVPGARAQGPGGGMPPEIAAKIKAWGKWRDAHKGISNVQTLFYQVEQMDKEKGYELNKVQSGKLLGIIKPWRTKPEMSDDQAKAMMKSVTGMLTDKQVKKMTTIQPPWARQGGGGGAGGGGGRPGGGGAGGGGGRPGGAGGFKFPDPPKGGYNPLNPDTLPFEQMRPMAKKNMDEFTAELQAKSK